MGTIGESERVHFELSAEFENGHGTANRMEIERAEQPRQVSGGDTKEGQGSSNGLKEDASGAEEDDMDMLREVR